MIFEPIIFSIFAFASTFLGGLFAVKFRSKLHYIMAFAAGVLLGVVAFDIFPEIIEQIKLYQFNAIDVMIALVVGFLLFHTLEKSILMHFGHEEEYGAHKHPQVGVLSATALIGHSFIDGVGIGLGFQVNSLVGILVAVAVISHDFTDGMNTITFMLSHKNTNKKAKTFLFFDALAPVLGVISTMFFTLPNYVLYLYLGFFAGFLLYIGASDILPEAHSEHSSYKLIFLTILGSLLIFLVTRLM